MRKYYWFLARTSLTVIVIQAVFFVLLCFSMPKVNKTIDATLESLHTQPAPVWALQQFYDTAYVELYRFQEANKQHAWLLFAIIMVGVVQLAISYSLYIHFLRMGYTWTKVCLHLNNLSLFLLFPGIIGFAWLIIYIGATRVIKHILVARSLRKDDSSSYEQTNY